MHGPDHLLRPCVFFRSLHTARARSARTDHGAVGVATAVTWRVLAGTVRARAIETQLPWLAAGQGGAPPSLETFGRLGHRRSLGLVHWRPVGGKGWRCATPHHIRHAHAVVVAADDFPAG